MKAEEYNRMRVMGNGQIYRLKTVFKMVKKFQKMNWIEQQSFFIGISDKVKPPINDEYTSKISLRKTKNKKYSQ